MALHLYLPHRYSFDPGDGFEMGLQLPAQELCGGVGFGGGVCRASLGPRLWRGASLAREVAVLGDGASMVWTLSEHLFPRATHILDWYHLTEHLWAAGRVLEPPGTEALARRIGRWKGALWEGRSEGVQEELWELARRGRDGADETLRKTAQYLDAHQVRTRYPQFRAAGWPIGSGVVEGACKELIDLRFTRKSTRWKLPGARTVLHLRLDRFSDRWETRREHMRQAA